MRNILFALLLGCLLVACSKSNKENNNEPAFVNGPSFDMIKGDTLPDYVDLTQDISRLSYQELRFLKSYVYAVHGHWLMEADINAIFLNAAPWYNPRCFERVRAVFFEDVTPEEKELAEKYYEALWKDTPKSFDFIELNDEEKAFIAKIDERMNKLMQSIDIKDKDGVTLLNPDLLVNWHQIKNADPQLIHRLRESNVAFARTNTEQLFNIYEENDYKLMPNFVTTDLLLQAYHMYFTYTLTSLERHVFLYKLQSFFENIIEQNNIIGSMPTDDEDLIKMTYKTTAFASVALKLLGEDVVVPEQISGLVETEYNLVMQCSDAVSPLFETETNFNYSLFRPRGHYTRTEEDQKYFRAMMWMQKGCFFREVEFQLKWAIYIAQLINQMPQRQQDELHKLNSALTFLMGESDNLSIIELAQKLRSAGVTTMDKALEPTNIAKVNQLLIDMGKGRNRISPKVAVGPQDQINLMPQRFNVDGMILGQMFDENVGAERAYPSGLDVMSMFDVKGATALLDTCYNVNKAWPGYKETFDEAKKGVAGFNEWDNCFYNKWLENLLVLQKKDKSQPGFMQTSTWEKKNLNTGLASWALLKHDAILYAEQPMAAECGGGEELPDPEVVGYVEPNVPFWKKLVETIELNYNMLNTNGYLSDDLEEKTMRLMDFVDVCLRVSEAELAGTPISSEDKYTVRGIGSSMEYFTLSVMDPDKEIYDWASIQGADRRVAQVADVFTRNITGCPKDGILYEATGDPHEIYVVVMIDGKCYLTRGATYSYYEFVRPLTQPRLTDEEWQKMMDEGRQPATTEWFAPLLLNKVPESDERYVYSTGC